MNFKKLFIGAILSLSLVISCGCNENSGESIGSTTSTSSGSTSKENISIAGTSDSVSNDLSSTDNSTSEGQYAEEGELKLRIFKMGKSDAYLFRTSSKTILIDCGDIDDSTEILEYFAEKSLKKIDYLILTHLDKKSIGGAASLISSLDIGSVYEPDYSKKSNEYIDFSSALSSKNITSSKVNSDISFDVDGVSFKISPCEKSYYSDDNNFSLMISVSHKDNSFLFVGDAKSDRINEIVSSGNINHDFLMIPDNGTYDSQIESLLNAVSPSYAAITCSEKNPASEEVLNILSQKNIDTYLTSNGSIKITSDGSEIIIEQ